MQDVFSYLLVFGIFAAVVYWVRRSGYPKGWKRPVPLKKAIKRYKKAAKGRSYLDFLKEEEEACRSALYLVVVGYKARDSLWQITRSPLRRLQSKRCERLQEDFDLLCSFVDFTGSPDAAAQCLGFYMGLLDLDWVDMYRHGGEVVGASLSDNSAEAEWPAFFVYLDDPMSLCVYTASRGSVNSDAAPLVFDLNTIELSSPYQDGEFVAMRLKGNLLGSGDQKTIILRSGVDKTETGNYISKDTTNASANINKAADWIMNLRREGQG